MRRLVHEACPERLQNELAKRAARIANGGVIGPEWQAFRKTATYRQLKDLLTTFLGDRARCCFCSDSNGADIEHFWPKEPYPDRAFEFENLLFSCSPCNRKKGTKFPLDASDCPLLINPATDDPWDSLVFIGETGMLDARMVGRDSQGDLLFDLKGSVTIDILGSIINGDPALLGRRRNWCAILVRLQEYMTTSRYSTAKSQDAVFGDVDEYGLSEWLVHREGKRDPTASGLLAQDPVRWRVLRELPRRES